MSCCGGVGVFLVWALFVAALVIGVIVLVRALTHWNGGSSGARVHEGSRRTTVEVLRERFARGEIDLEEFEERRGVLES